MRINEDERQRDKERDREKRQREREYEKRTCIEREEEGNVYKIEGGEKKGTTQI